MEKVIYVCDFCGKQIEKSEIKNKRREIYFIPRGWVKISLFPSKATVKLSCGPCRNSVINAFKAVKKERSK